MDKFNEKAYDYHEYFDNNSRPTLLEDVERQELTQQQEDRYSIPQSSTTKTFNQSTVFLDGLRGIAALWVFSQHRMGGGSHDRGYGQGDNYLFISLPFIRLFYNGGAAAVSIFFVLSGYVLSQTSVKLFIKGQYYNCERSIFSAVVRRPVRLYLPCIAVALIVALLLHLPNDFYPRLPWLERKETLGEELVYWFQQTMRYFNPFQHHGPDHEWYRYNFALWTIPIEFKGSMLVYALTTLCCLGLGLKPWVPGTLLGMTVVLLYLAWWSGACFVAGFALTIIDLYGLDTRYVLRHLPSLTRTIGLHLMLILSCYLLGQPAVMGQPEYSSETYGWGFLHAMIPRTYDKNEFFRFWPSYGAIMFVYCTLRLRWIQNLLSTRPLRFLGRVSFMFYVVHLSIFYVIGDRYVRALGHATWGQEEKWWDNKLYVPDIGPKGMSTRWLLDWWIMLAVCLSVAHLATKYIDQPCVTLAKKLSTELGLDSR